MARTRKRQPVNALTKAKILTFVAENWSNGLTFNTPDMRKKAKIIAIETNSSPATVELMIKRLTSETYKELHGDYPAGSLMTNIRANKWQRKAAKSLVKDGLVA